MANHPSAEKRHRQSLTRRERNRNAKSAIRTTLKAALAALSNDDTDAARQHAKKAEQLLAKAATKGVIHKKTAARTISRLATRVSKAKKA